MRVLYLSISLDSAKAVRLRRAVETFSTGTTVEVCTTAVQVRQRLETRQPCQAIVLDDVAIANALPALVRHLRAEAPGVRIVLLTEDESEETLARGVLAGVDCVLLCVDDRLSQIAAALTGPPDPGAREVRQLEVLVWGAGRHLLPNLEKSERLSVTPVADDQTTIDPQRWQGADALLLVATRPEEAAVLLQRLRTKVPTLPVVALAEEKNHDGLLRLGATECLPLDSAIAQIELTVARSSQLHRLLTENGVLKTKEGRLRSIVESLPVGVLVAGPDGTVHAINHAAVSLCRADAISSALGRQLPDIFGPTSRESVARLIADVTGGTPASIELDVNQGDAAPRRLDLRAVPFYREQGQPLCILLTIGDVPAAPHADHAAPLLEQVNALTDQIEQERIARRAAEQERAHAADVSVAAVAGWQERAELSEKSVRELEQVRAALEENLAAAETRLAEAAQLQEAYRIDAEAVERLTAEIASRDRALDDARRESQDVRRTHEDTRRELDDVRRELDATSITLHDVEQERAALRSEVADRGQTLDSVSRELVSLQALQAEAEIARTELQADIGRRDVALAAAVQQLEEVRTSQAEALQTTQTEAALERRRLEDALATAMQQLERLRTSQAEALRASQAETADERGRLEDDLARRSEALHEATSDLDSLRQAHAAACAAFLKGKRSQASLEQEIGVLRACLDDARTSVERANADAEQACLARDDWRRRAEAAIERIASEELAWQRNAEAAFDCRPSEELEWIMGVATIGLVTTDFDGDIERCSTVAARLCGWTDADELSARDRLPQALLDAGASARRARRFESWIQGADGLLRRVLVVVTPRRNGASDDEHLEWLLVDLSEQYNQERQARLLLHLDTLTHFLSSATRECKTLLGQVGHTVDTLSARGPREVLTPNDSLNATRKALMRTRSVLKQMAAGAKNGARRPVVLDLADVFDRASPLLARLAGDDTECDVVGPGQPLLVAADPAEVDQLLTAIVLSGRECLPAGGRLSLSGRVFPAEVSRDGQTVVQPSVALTLCASGYGAQPVVWQQASDLAAHLGGSVEVRHDAAACCSTIEVVLPSVIQLACQASGREVLTAGQTLPGIVETGRLPRTTTASLVRLHSRTHSRRS